MEADKNEDVEAKSAYEPMLEWYADRTAGNSVTYLESEAFLR